MQFNQQLLVTYECVNAIGTSLDLEAMLRTFLRVFARKSGAIASGFWRPNAEGFALVCGQGKRSLYGVIAPERHNHSWDLHVRRNGEQVLYMYVGKGVMSFMFYLGEEELAAIEAILRSLHAKLDNAICACNNHEALVKLNTTLEEKVRFEVEQNREKDKHILQQSRLAQMGEMISMIAHQWRQPLGSISTVAASIKVKLMLKKFNLQTEEGQQALSAYMLESVEKIEHYVKFLTTTIDDFRNFFKPDKRRDSTTLYELVERTLGVIGKALEVNGITLVRQECSSRTLVLHTNEVMQVILNLLKNAEDAIKERNPSEKTIWLRTYDTPEVSVLEIEDSAGGIEPLIMEKIFEPYFSTKEEKNGTGLGLYMSKTIIEDHAKGRIHVANTARGACFTIVFAVKEEGGEWTK
ncbi:MAG: GHKL domain-containing protein [Campylobacterales bacterium]|nr:GHKL domain-containing protein [Campylobacterales bacterium]